MKHEIKKYKPLVWAKINTFNEHTETLYWEWKLEDFEKALQCDVVRFPRHANRWISPDRIIKWWYWVVEDDTLEKDLEMKLSSINSELRKKIKARIKLIKTNLWREATKKEIDNIIKHFLWQNEKKQEQYKSLWPVDRFKTFLVIKRQKIASILTWSYIWFKPYEVRSFVYLYANLILYHIKEIWT